jgi:hypothetical protein
LASRNLDDKDSVAQPFEDGNRVGIMVPYHQTHALYQCWSEKELGHLFSFCNLLCQVRYEQIGAADRFRSLADHTRGSRLHSQRIHCSIVYLVRTPDGNRIRGGPTEILARHTRPMTVRSTNAKGDCSSDTLPDVLRE